jgi:iron complex transport system substrate-binding protein
MLFAIGAGEQVVGVTHECDFPPEALGIDNVTRDVIDRSGMDAIEIDQAVRTLTEEGKAIYELDVFALESLNPDLIVTQELCAVCAVAADDVLAIAEKMPVPPTVLSLDPHTIGEMLGDIRTLAHATDRKDDAVDLVRDLADRIDRVKLAVRDAPRKRVLAIEWFDPLFIAGHWTPQLIEWAGGDDVLGLPGEKSEVRSWEEAAAMRPEIVVVMPCGYDADRALTETDDYAEELASLGAERIVAVDASAWFSRPGPRLVEGLEALAHILHPDRVPEAPGPVYDV